MNQDGFAGYFHRVHRLSPTRLWINNPTPSEADRAIAAGAISCTTNPAFAMKQLNSDETREAAAAAIDEAVAETGDDDEAAELVVCRLTRPILERFLPLYNGEPRKQGFVSIQGNPFREDDADHVVCEALNYRKLGVNFIAKIPVIQECLQAIERLVAEDVPIIATEVMGLPQAIAACEAYRRASLESGKSPPFYLTHITGIFDEYLKKTVEAQGIDIAPDLLWQAGSILARLQYRVVKERAYPCTMLGGGARDLHHFTEMVGADMHITINWAKTADRLIELDPPVVWRMFNPAPDAVVRELLAKVPDFARAFQEDGLSTTEFKDFGPVVHFREMFRKGWAFLREAVRQRRRAGVHG